MATGKKEKHRCPALPEGLEKVTPQGWNGESAEQAKKLWYAWLRIVQKQQPMKRRTH